MKNMIKYLFLLVAFVALPAFASAHVVAVEIISDEPDTTIVPIIVATSTNPINVPIITTPIILIIDEENVDEVVDMPMCKPGMRSVNFRNRIIEVPTYLASRYTNNGGTIIPCYELADTNIDFVVHSE